MLPDYPIAKVKLMKRLLGEMKGNMSREMGFLGTIPRSIFFEGDRSIIKRADGTIQEVKYNEISAQIAFTENELVAAIPKSVDDKLIGMAKQMAEKQSKMMFGAMEDEISKVGNTVDGQGRPFSVDIFMEGIQKIQIDFDHKTGKPHLPTVVAHPSSMEKMKEELKKLNDDPKYRNSFEELIEKKKGEWLARESNRKLVG